MTVQFTMDSAALAVLLLTVGAVASFLLGAWIGSAKEWVMRKVRRGQ